jgi:hypothetical protein
MRSFCAAAVLLCCTLARAGEPLVIGPYVQDLRSDGFTVVFETAGDVAAEVHAGAVRVVTHGHHHEAVLRGLPPATRVPYRVFVGGADAGGGEVTLYDPRRPLTFVVYGDSRSGDVGARVAALARAQEPLFALNTGDFAPNGADVAGWTAFFHDEAPLLRDVPLYPAMGNHELFRDPQAAHFRRYFALPDEGRARLYYSFRVGPAAFLVLDGNHPGPAQTAWLAAALEAARRDGVAHVFVLEHQPPLSMGGHCGSALEQADWMKLFEQYRVRAVFAGHDHAYERLERRGVRYFVSGGGGAPVYEERASCPASDRASRRVYLPVHHILRVRVDGPHVEVAALPLDGGPPLDVSRMSAGEPAFAMDAPPLQAPSSDSRMWTLAGGAVLFFLLGLVVRRRRG